MDLKLHNLTIFFVFLLYCSFLVLYELCESKGNFTWEKESRSSRISLKLYEVLVISRILWF